MGIALRFYVPALIADYAHTHQRSFEPIPADVVALTDLWLNGRDHEDGPRPPRRPGEYPAVVQAARYLADSLIAASEHYALVMATRPDLLHQIVIAAEIVRHASGGFEMIDKGQVSDSAAIEASSLAKSVAAVKGFVVVLGRYAPRWVTVTGEQVELADRWRAEWIEQSANVSDTPPSDVPPTLTDGSVS